MNKGAKRFIPSLEQIHNIRLDQKHKKEALIALRDIEKNTGYTLSKKLESQIKEYAKETFGSSVYAYWLYVYAAFNQKFVEGWIPDNYFGKVVAPKINKGIGEVSQAKTLSRKILNTDLLPDRFYLIDKTFYDLNFNPIDPKEVHERLFENNQEFFFKKDRSSQGKGVIKITKDNFNMDTVLSFGDGVIQESIVQSEWFDQIITGSVASIRITTVKDLNQQVKARAALLRVGRRDSQFVEAKTSIKIPIIDMNGTLEEYGLSTDWKRYYKHPDSGFEFANQKIPHFSKAVRICEELHSKIPHFSVIGWDVVITNNDEVRIIEWNTKHPGIKLTEATIGPSFSDLNWENLWKD